MSKTWIVDVLADLQMFAKTNDLPLLADQLADTTIVAMAELATPKPPQNAAPVWQGDIEAGPTK